ncbi:MAG: class I SAM-dependent methyltransferase [Anaerolineae bacterium]|nr:class I SAM-dependent methyltransferase [Anaerolineae bacterium]
MSDSQQARVQAQFGQHAAAYVTSATHAAGAELARLVALAQPQPGWTMLDVATGGGHTALTFAPRVRQVIACDVTLPMLRAARDFVAGQGAGGVWYGGGAAEHLPFAPARFDLITCRIAAHHFSDLFGFVLECARVLKPGGRLLVQDMVLPPDEQAARYVDAFEKYRDPSHQRAYADYEWQGTLLDAGLTVEHSEIIQKRHELIPWAQRTGCPPDVIDRLQVLLLRAPAPVREWMQPDYAGTDYATFCNRHILLCGSKP